MRGRGHKSYREKPVTVETLQITAIAAALAADCFAVSISGGALSRKPLATAIKLGALFTVAQAGMFSAGWWLGGLMRQLFLNTAKLAAFAFLAIAGGHMLRGGAYTQKNNASPDMEHPLVLVSLSLATGVDALAAGLGLSMLYQFAPWYLFIIGAAALVMSFAGVAAGKKAKTLLKDKAEFAGGIILILIGIKILLENTT